MDIFKQIYKVWQKVVNQSIKEDLSIQEIIKTRLLNIVLMIAFALLLLLLIRAVTVQEHGQVTIIASFLVLIIVLFYLNISGHQVMARLAVVLLLTSMIALVLLFIHPSPWELEYIFLMIIFVNYIFFKGNLQIITSVIVLLIFSITYLVEPSIPMEYKIMVPLTPGLPMFLFIFFVIHSFITLTYYQFEIKKYQANQKQTILALKQGNIKLKSVSEELERFIFIVSTDLKSRLIVVRDFLKDIRANVNAKNYSKLDDSIDKAMYSAKKMHFWVNDILEFANVNQLGKRIEKEIALEETLKTVKNNLQGVIKEVEISIKHEALPTVHLNELEVFIVFYNLIKMAFFTYPENAKVTVKSYHNNEFLCIQFIRTSNTIDLGHSLMIKEVFDNLNYSIKLCELIIKGWEGQMYISESEKKSSYEIFIPKSKVIL